MYDFWIKVTFEYPFDQLESLDFYKKFSWATIPQRHDVVGILGGMFEISDVWHYIDRQQYSPHVLVEVRLPIGAPEKDLAPSEGWLSHKEYIQENTITFAKN